MATTLELKLYTAAQSNAGLTALLGMAPFRYFDMQAPQGMTLPTVEALLVSTVAPYAVNKRGTIVQSRVQFTIRDIDAERARSVEAALMSFLDGFNALGVANNSPLQANRVVNRRQGGNAQTQPVTYWRTLDAMIWNNENI